MAHQEECFVLRDLVDLAMEHGPEAMAAAFASLMNRDTLIEREQVLKAESRSWPVVKATQTASSPGRSTPASGRSICGSRRPAATTTGMDDPSTPRPSFGVSAASGR